MPDQQDQLEATDPIDPIDPNDPNPLRLARGCRVRWKTTRPCLLGPAPAYNRGTVEQVRLGIDLDGDGIRDTATMVVIRDHTGHTIWLPIGDVERDPAPAQDAGSCHFHHRYDCRALCREEVFPHVDI